MSVDITVKVKVYEEDEFAQTEPPPIVLRSDDDDDMVVIEVGGRTFRVVVDDLMSAVAKFV